MRPTYHIRDFVGYTNQHRHLTCWRAEHYILHHAIDNTANQSTGKSLYTRQYYTLTRRTLHWLCWPLIFYSMVWNRYTLGEKSLREYWGILWKSLSLQQNLAPATSCTNSNWFVFLRLVARRKWLKLVLSQHFAASEYFCKTSLQQTHTINCNQWKSNIQFPMIPLRPFQVGKWTYEDKLEQCEDSSSS